ncbi:MAG TPA: hypothetical protein VJW95_00485 [Dissulfurispiraceae bacterium]|nr:hypothetical protein [Dissulfurispiraceae bacterium]
MQEGVNNGRSKQQWDACRFQLFDISGINDSLEIDNCRGYMSILMERNGLLSKSAVILFCFLVLTVVACDELPFGYTKIGDIVKNPAAFDGMEIKIRGKVTNVTKLPFIQIKFYSLDDGTGQILVTTEKNIPGMEEKVAVKVRIESMAIGDNQSIGLHAKEVKRL